MQHFTASDGARIAYRDEGAGRPLVLLHGFMAHGGFFRGQAPLAANHRLIVIDLRGHGESPANAPKVERIAADVAELAAALDLRDAIGVGWSLGATVLWHVLAGEAGQRFAGAVIVDMTARVCNGEGWSLGLSPEVCTARSSAIREDFENFAAGAGQAMFAQPLRAELREVADWASAEFVRNDPAAMAAVWGSLVDQDLRALIAGIRQPTLVVHGGQSQLYGDDTTAHLVATLPDARALRFEQSGHAPHLEEPERFNRALADFAGRLSRAGLSQAAI
ncbi:alpha/beta fold hydrolase [Sphingosinicella sp.]|uniref:alpha/beta fold hydrolase n=1 Tax=Sphingosinicella sp. TaxID=1917971 RepID=UPI0040384E5C